MKSNKKEIIISVVLTLVIILLYYAIEKMVNTLYENNNSQSNSQNAVEIIEITDEMTDLKIDDIPEYAGSAYIEINSNKPFFKESDYTTKAFENYSELDVLGRCGVAYANICKETMPPDGDERGNIGSVYPTGWVQTKIKGEYLYNRCHLIAYCLSDEDANKLNLITGTRYFNVQGMLVFEKKVLDYMKSNPDNHVLYRVTPFYKEYNLLATGVEMEAYSVEDKGEGICFNIFVYNVQPGVKINYETGEVIK